MTVQVQAEVQALLNTRPVSVSTLSDLGLILSNTVGFFAPCVCINSHYGLRRGGSIIIISLLFTFSAFFSASDLCLGQSQKNIEGWYILRSINSSAGDTQQSNGEVRYGSDPSSTAFQ